MDGKKTATNGGIRFCGALTILFIGLKLAHVIDWAWKWVLSPLWLPVAVIVGLLVLIEVLSAVMGGTRA